MWTSLLLRVRFTYCSTGHFTVGYQFTVYRRKVTSEGKRGDGGDEEREEERVKRIGGNEGKERRREGRASDK